jgi:uncharacterized membrane protein
VTISQKALALFTVVATFLLATGYASRGTWQWSALIIAFGIFWLYAQRRMWGRVASFGLIFFVLAAGRGIFMDISTGWLLLSVVATLAAWDLDYFVRRLKKVERVEKPHDLEQRHLKRLMSVAALGLLLGGVAIAVEVQLNFGWVLFWGVVLILGMSRLIDLLNREND